jgi:hypothetical protein
MKQLSGNIKFFLFGLVLMSGSLLFNSCRSSQYGPAVMQCPKIVYATYVKSEYQSTPLIIGLALAMASNGSNLGDGQTFYYYKFKANDREYADWITDHDNYDVLGQTCLMIYDSMNFSDRILFKYDKVFLPGEETSETIGVITDISRPRKLGMEYIYYKYVLNDTAYRGTWVIGDSVLLDKYQINDSIRVFYSPGNLKRSIPDIPGRTIEKFDIPAIKIPKYTYATHIESFNYSFTYTFRVNGNDYYRTLSFHNTWPAKGEKCRVVYDSLDPAQFYILPNNRIILPEEMPKKVQGRVVNVSVEFKNENMYSVFYRYYVGKKKYTGFWTYNGRISNAKYRKGDTLNVTYSAKNPKYSVLEDRN